jgi:FixJ family two-component response regulator
MIPSPCVFIVDDDSPVRDSLALWIGMRGYRARAFATAEEFLDVARPDLRGYTLVDLRFSAMDGLQLQEELGRRAVSLPIVFITGHGDVSSARAALKGGAFDFIEKPLDNDRVLELVAAAMAADAKLGEGIVASDRITDRIARLTPREREVMDHVSSLRDIDPSCRAMSSIVGDRFRHGVIPDHALIAAV